jgi:SAM-dependent methyltransferase
MPNLAESPSATEQYCDAANLNARIALHAHFSTNPYSWQRWVWDQLDLPPGNHILELGCGPGDLWVENQDRTPTEWYITLSDLSPGMVQQAQCNLGPLPARFRPAVADAVALPFPTAAFDTIIANHMLYHVPDRRQALHEIRRVLRSRGRLYATTVGLGHLRELRELILRVAPEVDPDSLAEINPFTLESGGEQLAPYFAHVTVRRYEDNLRVTAAEPLVAYILSAPIWAEAIGDRVDRLEQEVRAQLAADGVIYVTKDSGLFIAW